MERKVVITGIGVLSPLGKNAEQNWSNLKNGISGIKKLSLFDESAYKIDVNIAGEVPDFSLANYFEERKAASMAKDMDRFAQLAMAAAKEAVTDSGIDQELKAGTLRPEDVAMFVGTGIGGVSTTSDDLHTLIYKGPKRVGVRTIFRMMPNAAAGQIGIEFGLRGQSKSISTACASGLDALLDAYHQIKFGLSEIVVSGGAEASVMPLAIASFSNMRALSKRPVDPTKASCPFSLDRDGFVMSEGSVIYILEEKQRAVKRGAKIYAEILGGAGTCDAYHITAPHAEAHGSAGAMTQALERAKLNPEDIKYIHAHGTSTPLNDARETLGIKRAFKDHAYKLAVSSTKSMTGHMIAAAGPMGVFASVNAINNQILPPTINYVNPDPECDLDYVPNTAREVNGLNYVMINALGFGGHNTCLVIGKA